MKKFYLFFFLGLVITSSALCQPIDTVVEKTKRYPFKTHFFSAGILTDGWQYIGYEYQFGKNPLSKKLFGFQFNEKKHPKEYKQKVKSDIADFSIIYGKQNIAYPLHFYYGNILTLGKPNEHKGINISLSYKIGLSLALIRPYYISTYDTSSNPKPETTINLKYTQKDSLLFFDYTMLRDNPSFLGWNQLSIIPGIHGACSIDFEFANPSSPQKKMGVRVSLFGETYAKPLPIMVEKPNIINNMFYLSGQITFYFSFSNQ